MLTAEVLLSTPNRLLCRVETFPREKSTFYYISHPPNFDGDFLKLINAWTDELHLLAAI